MGFNVSNLCYPQTLNGKRVMFTPFSKYGASDAGGGILVAGLSATRILIHGLVAVAGSAVSFALWRNMSTILGPIPLAANGQLVLPFNEFGWAQGSHYEAINLWTNAAATVTGVLIYSEVD
jgi:hypothetical protein